MSDKRKRSQWEPIAAAVFVLLVWYPLSYGPACHLLKYVPEEHFGTVNNAGELFYRPLWCAAGATNNGQRLADYATWCNPATTLYLPFRSHWE